MENFKFEKLPKFANFQGNWHLTILRESIISTITLTPTYTILILSFTKQTNKIRSNMQRRYDRTSDITRLRAHYRERPYEFKHCCNYIWHCTLTSKLGCGSFGSVYFGFHEVEGFEVAVKEIPRELFARDEKVKINLQRYRLISINITEYILCVNIYVITWDILCE